MRPGEGTILPATSDTEMGCSHVGSDAQKGSKTCEQCTPGVSGRTGGNLAGSDPQPLDEEVWLKFNDISVTEVKWDEVARESFGGPHNTNTSAYCLVYVNSALSSLWCENGRWEEPGGKVGGA